MDAIALLRNRVAAMPVSLRGLVEGTSGVDLAKPVVPGTSPLALTLWHIARTPDWLVQATIRDVPEVADSMRDGLPDPEQYGFGIGLTPEEALEAASQVEVPALLSYADAVAAEIDGWLASVSEQDLDVAPPLLDRQAKRAIYSRPEGLAELQGLIGVPVGILLLRPAMGHLFAHIGEVDLLLQLAKQPA